MPVHWFYKQSDLLEHISDKDKPEFGTPSCPYYNSNDFPGHYTPGSSSCYGEQLVGFLEAAKTLGGGSNSPQALCDEVLKFIKGYGGRHDGCMNDFVKNVEEKNLTWPNCGGSGQNQAQCFYKGIVALVTNGGTLDDEQLEVIIRSTQNNDEAFVCGVAYAHFLQALLKGETKENALAIATVRLAQLAASNNGAIAAVAAHALEGIAHVKKYLDKPTYEMLVLWDPAVETVEEALEKGFFMALSCHNPMALMRTLHVCLRATSYAQGLRDNLLVGGDNCSTALAVGAALAVVYGVPGEWVEKFTGAGSATALVDSMLA
jgi:hypothetical protein